MEPYKITVELNLKNVIAELREVAQSLNEFADDLEQVDKKYTDQVNCTCTDEEVGKWICSVDTCEAICSCCHACSGEPFSYAQRHLKYCNNCGAKMEGVS